MKKKIMWGKKKVFKNMGAGISNLRSTKKCVVENCKFPPLMAT